MASDRIIGSTMIFGRVIQYDLAHYCASRHGRDSPKGSLVIALKEQSYVEEKVAKWSRKEWCTVVLRIELVDVCQIRLPEP